MVNIYKDKTEVDVAQTKGKLKREYSRVILVKSFYIISKNLIIINLNRCK
ncbi:hypothetical protein Phi14:2_gp004 [Cellulophaga phage phi14:2]|uniref:Uncharacterized protein n=1 Tax=Cellulophaga phage phi14:2 TaxID=1327990 RepID=S0A357_9CAUD|nr:hypothetical protein Phi14:2_gp004 [Cellulophaga phage phi14:2]